MLEELKEKSYAANMAIWEHRLIHLTFGNASVIDRRAGIFAIKPSGVSYAALRPADMVLVDLEGRKVEGALNPSSDTPTHLQLFRGFEGVGAVAHTHSKFATSFAQAGLPVPCLGTTHADYFHGEIPVTRSMTASEVEGRYEFDTGSVILERFRGIDPLSFPGVLVRNHGVFAWAPTGDKVAEIALVMELLAEMAIHTLQLNPAAKPIDRALLDKHFLRKHGAKAYYGQKPDSAPAGNPADPR